MNPLEVYQIYIAIRTHFKDKNFNFQKYGKTKVSVKTFENRKDRYFFEKLSRRYNKEEIVDFFISQMLSGRTWIGDMFGEEAQTDHLARMGRLQSIQYLVKTETKTLWEIAKEHPLKFNLLFAQTKENYHPKVFKLFMEKKISPETLLILNEIANFISDWKLEDDPVWDEIGIPLLKYAPFLHLNTKRDEFKKIVYEIITNNLHTNNT